MSTLYSPAATYLAILWQAPLKQFHVGVEKRSLSPQKQDPSRDEGPGVVVQMLLSLLFLVDFAL